MAETTLHPLHFDMKELGAKHVAIVPQSGNHPAPKSLDDLNAEIASMNIGDMEFVKYEEEKDPHLEAFLSDQGGTGE